MALRDLLKQTITSKLENVITNAEESKLVQRFISSSNSRYGAMQYKLAGKEWILDRQSVFDDNLVNIIECIDDIILYSSYTVSSTDSPHIKYSLDDAKSFVNAILEKQFTLTEGEREGQIITTVKGSGIGFSSISYNKNVIVALLSEGFIYRSLNNGIEWNMPNNLNTILFNDITFSNKKYYNIACNDNKFIIVGDKILISEDNMETISKIIETINDNSFTFKLATYGKDRFIVVGDNGISYYSLDGENWIEMTGLDTTVNYNKLIYGKDRFIVVGNSGKSYYSTDGETWISMNGVTSTNNINSVAYGNNMYVCTGRGGESYSSKDGINWEPISGLSAEGISANVFYIG